MNGTPRQPRGVPNDQAYGVVAGGAAAGEASGAASGELPAALAPEDLFILSVFPGDVLFSALAAAAACRLQRLTLLTEMLISVATCLMVLP
jgi:hypothetical protein